ncbi:MULTISPECIES: NUDIX domain-containing protein [Streptomyces]|uniref:NUDIX domain-containing protein n=1 Tax=Streptomyces globisporus TaxID=1908 RepID=A0A927BJJ0_STRGL|nr:MULTISPECIES: NUDIX domain-containing protein [Streptomyces]MBD2828012.1 NUDIX domain-containing protein [Streptomyces globisporus]MBD3546631.1 NUDIX domain-containing protein [Streptomyces sp. JV180]
MNLVRRIVAGAWRLIRGPLQWRVLWVAHSKFMVGVTGVVRDDAGRVLLLRHRMWPPEAPWGLPTGYAVAGEEFTATIVREVKEETGLDVKPGALVRLRSGFKLRVEVAYEAHHVGGTLKIDSFEILEAQWFDPNSLPPGMQDAHRQLIAGNSPS